MLEIRPSVCALDCPDCCSLLVSVENGRGVKLRGDPSHPVTRGFLCGKVAQYLEREYSPERLLDPLRRAGAKGAGRFARISWDEALDAIAARWKAIAAEFGSEAILPYSYGGSMGLLNGSGMDRRFFHRLGASRLDRTICSTAGMAGMTEALGVRYGTEPEQFRRARLILAWGANILGTNAHLWPFIVEARRQGAKLYAIDPRRNRTSAAADKHFAIHPGSDAALALAMMHVIVVENLHDAEYVARHTEGFEGLRERVREWTPERAAGLTGIEAGEIAALAREYASTRPAVIRLNYGIQRSERGAMAVRAAALLPALTGSWKDVGGGLQLSTSQAFHLNRDGLERADLQWKALGREARIVNMTELGGALGGADDRLSSPALAGHEERWPAPRSSIAATNEDRTSRADARPGRACPTPTSEILRKRRRDREDGILDPPVMSLAVYNSNPAAVAPNQNAVLRGLRREDLFTVVLEQFRTDTADYADIVLPVTTFLEHTDLYLAYGHYYLQLARPALPAPGETKSNVEIFRLLAARMGFDDPCFGETDDDMIRTLLDSPHPFMAGISIERLDRERSVRLRLPEPFLPFADGGFGAPDGKCHFHAETLDYAPPVESRRGDPDLRSKYPLELISPKNDDGMNSTFGHRDAVDLRTAVLQINAGDAEARGIRTSDRVRAYNARGSCALAARVDDAAQPGVVCAPAVRWARRSPGGRNINALTSERLTDAGGGATFYSCLVQVERIEDS